MTGRRGTRLVRALGGLALVPVLAYGAGLPACADGGLVRVDAWFHHAAVLTAAPVVAAAAMLLEVRRRPGWGFEQGSIVVSVAVASMVTLWGLTLLIGGHRAPVEQHSAADRSGRTVTVTDVSHVLGPRYLVEVRTGDGWSARHWALGTEWDEEALEGVAWTGPNEVTVTGWRSLLVHPLDPATGRPGEPRQVPR